MSAARQVLLDLATRCETEEPSRQLEIAIFNAVGEINEAHCTAWCNQNRRTDLTRERYITAWTPNYCLSLDAAVTLVPEGYCRAIRHLPPDQPRASVWSRDFAIEENADGRTMALALCAAALRARAEAL